MDVKMQKVYDAFGGNDYDVIRGEFYSNGKLLDEVELKAWEIRDKAIDFINKNENVIMYFFKRSKLSLINI